MCIRIIGTRSLAQRGSMSGSAHPAETSFTRSAPSASARRTTSALVVSIESGTQTAARTARSTGISRASSSASATGRAPGRVDSAPRSSAPAPAATISRAAAAARAGSRYRPPSWNESGVAFSTPTSAGGESASGPARVCSTGPPGAAGVPGSACSGRGGRRAPEATVLVPELAQDLVDLGAVDRLALEECLRHLVQDLEIPAQEQLGALVGLEHDATHLAVDLHGGVLGVVDLLGEVAAEEDLLLLPPEGHGPELL